MRSSRLLPRTAFLVPRHHSFVGDGSLFDLSLGIHRHGIERGFWGDEMMIVDFDDNPESLAAAPLASAKRCPVIATRGAISYDASRALCMKQHNRALVVGHAADMTIDDRLRKRGISVERIACDTPQKTCIALCERTLVETQPPQNGGRELCVASLSLSQWPELLGCGAYAAKRDSALLLENPHRSRRHRPMPRLRRRSSAQVDKLVFIGKKAGSRASTANCSSNPSTTRAREGSERS